MPGHGGLVSFANQEIGAGEEALDGSGSGPGCSRPSRDRPSQKVVYIETDDSQKVQLMMDINVIR